MPKFSGPLVSEITEISGAAVGHRMIAAIGWSVFGASLALCLAGRGRKISSQASHKRENPIHDLTH